MVWLKRNVQLWGCFLLSMVASMASDWPQFLGPSRDGVYPGADVTREWTKSGPPVVWQKSVGQGFSGPVIAQGRLILFHRLNDQETIECLDSKTGKGLWSSDYPSSYRDDFGFDEGPRATPAIADGKVYTHGAEGTLTCVDFETGKKTWSIDTKKEFGWAKGFFGVACSPLVERDAVLLNIGGREGAGLVAFQKQTGKVLWKASNEEASYSSPVIGEFQGKRLALFLAKGSLLAADPANGNIAFSFPFRPPIRSSVTAAAPLVAGNYVFISASYGLGAALLETDGSTVKKIWANDDSLSAHYTTSVHHNGYLYGIQRRS